MCTIIHSSSVCSRKNVYGAFLCVILACLFFCMACSCYCHWTHLVKVQLGYHTGKPSILLCSFYETEHIWSCESYVT
jgi:hypothetical protein